jgi:hypothetical protein
MEGQVPIFISPRNRVALIYPGHCVPVPSPLTTRRAMVEVFYPASTQDYSLGWEQIKIYHVHHCCVTTICSENMFATLKPSSGSVFLPHYSGFQPICHIVYWNVKFVVLCFISQNIFIGLITARFS